MIVDVLGIDTETKETKVVSIPIGEPLPEINSIKKYAFYPKGYVMEFNKESDLIDFIELLPDDVWDYFGNSVNKFYFKRNYYFEIKE